MVVAQPCDVDGASLPTGQPPTPPNLTHDWTPFKGRAQYELTELLFEKIEASNSETDRLLEILLSDKIMEGGEPLYGDADSDHSRGTASSQLKATIDAIQWGDAPFQTFRVRYGGPIDDDSPEWKKTSYEVHTRNAQSVLRNMIQSVDFKDSFDYRPYAEYTKPGHRRWSHFMSGHWAWKEAVRVSMHFCHGLPMPDMISPTKSG